MVANLSQIHRLDLPSVATVEFPANVQNPSKAIEMLGGREKIEKAIKDKEQLELRLRPGDPFEHPITSRTTKYQNIVLKVTISKKFLDEANGDVKKALELSQNSYRVSPAFLSTTNFRFREMSDFQYATVNSPFLAKFNTSVKLGDYEKLKGFQFAKADIITDEQIDAMPPPRFSQIMYPYSYGYRQNPAISVVDDGSGGSKLVNTIPVKKLESLIIPWGEPIPERASDKLETPEPPVQKCIQELKKLFEKRPLWTRTALESLLTNESRRQIRFALPYVAYSFGSGPWRRAYARFGLDPTSSNEYAKYQVEHYRIFTFEHVSTRKDEWVKEREKMGDDEVNTGAPLYQFDGKTLPISMMLQLLDVTDPQLADLFSSARMKDECDREYGWFNAEDLTLIRKVLRIKLVSCVEGETMSDEKIQSIIREQRRLVSGGSKERKDKDGEGEEDEDEEGEEGEEEEDIQRDEDNSVLASESEILEKLGGQVDGGSEKLKDLFGYVQQGGQDYGGYDLMEDDDDEEVQEEDEDEEAD